MAFYLEFFPSGSALVVPVVPPGRDSGKIPLAWTCLGRHWVDSQWLGRDSEPIVVVKAPEAKRTKDAAKQKNREEDRRTKDPDKNTENIKQ